MIFRNLKNLKKKFFLCIISLLIVSSDFFAEEWVLAAKKFEWTQNKKHNTAEEDFSLIMPQLLLEQISSGLIRNTSTKEMMDRTLESYLIERQSLFLQLSKDYKTRDSLVLTTDNAKKLAREIKKQQKIIEETETKLEENLNKTEQLHSEYNEYLKKQNGEETAKSDFNIFFNPLTNLFVTKKEKLLPDTEEENISIYKNDSSQLYSTGENYKKNGPESRSFEKELINAKINGFIDGAITVYGDYFSVTCSLYIYPGHEKLGTITEVGKIRNCDDVVVRLASYFCPLITNRMPVELYFEIKPDDISADCHVTVDGIYFEKIPPMLKLDTGKHTVKIECADYWTRMITYEFTGAEKFLIKADMIKETNTELSIALVNPEAGKIYADGKFSGDILKDNFTGKYISGGDAVIGHFMADRKDKSGERASFFYYVPENLAASGEIIAVNGKARDHASYIDKRRIWTYRAYTLLVISMPFTLYYTAQYNSSVYAYNSGILKDIDEVYSLQRKRNTCLAITAACTGAFVVELVRYLVAANSVLPVNAHKATDRELKKAEKKWQAYESTVQAQKNKNSGKTAETEESVNENKNSEAPEAAAEINASEKLSDSEEKNAAENSANKIENNDKIERP